MMIVYYTKLITKKCFKYFIYLMCTLICIYVIIFWLKAPKRNLKLIYADTKFILFWSPLEKDPFYHIRNVGEGAFFRHNCDSFDCYATDNRDLLEDVSQFDAIVFDGRSLPTSASFELPKSRSPKQKYIFYQMESSDNYPLCDPIYDEMFNWTMTYKLDSDILNGYILIKDLTGKEIGPRRIMDWAYDDGGKISKLPIVDMSLKNKSGAWFVSVCNSRSKRHNYFWTLETALGRAGLGVDIYGACGYKLCPRETGECDYMLRKYYYFYLAFENSFAEDYVTEKVLRALQNDVVPIVYGGADYYRFLPPGSYINARDYTPENLARLIQKLMKNHTEYLQYFKWKQHYTFHDPIWVDNFCKLCAAVNSDNFREYTLYHELRMWWNPDYEKRCQDSVGKYKTPGFFKAVKHTKKGPVPLDY